MSVKFSVNFNPQSFIDKGVPISANFLIDHLTGGAFHPVIGSFLPIYGTALNPEILKGTPLWKLARNLSISSESILEPMLKEFGNGLVLRTGFLLDPVSILNREIGHSIGLSLDIQIKGFENSLAPLAKDIQQIANKASSMSLIFDSSSWMHINVNPQKALQTALKVELPRIRTFDLVNNIVEQGIQNYRGQ